jgi:hypothetical protein
VPFHHGLVWQVVKPFFSNELSVGCNVIYLYVCKDFSEFFEQFFALYVVRVSSDLAPFSISGFQRREAPPKPTFTVRALRARTVNAKGARSEFPFLSSIFQVSGKATPSWTTPSSKMLKEQLPNSQLVRSTDNI